MKLSGLLKWIGFMTVLALMYIHMQMSIIHLAYQGRYKEKVIRDLVEENGYLTYSILSMKSANNLGYKLLSEDSDMDFVDSKNIMTLNASEDANQQIAANNKFKEKSNFLISLLSFGAQAEARGR